MGNGQILKSQILNLKFSCPNHPDRPGIVTKDGQTPCWQCYLGDKQFNKRFGPDFYSKEAS